MIRPYETTILMRPDLDDAEQSKVIDFIKDLAAKDSVTINSIDVLGKKSLAYHIKQISEAYYYLISFDSSPAFVLELDRNLRISDKVVRFLTVVRPLRAEPFAKTIEKQSTAVDETKVTEDEDESGEE